MCIIITEKKFGIYTLIFLFLAGVIVSCSTPPQKPDLGSEEYRQAVSDFYVGLAAMQSNKAMFAVEKMQEVADAYPAEPAAWANLSVFAMRQGNFELATKQIQKALTRTEENANIYFLAGILESRKGDIQKSLEHLREAARLDSTNAKVLYALAEELEREDPGGNVQRIKELLNQILKQKPNNLAVLLETVRTAAKWGNRSSLKQALNELEEQSENWPDQIQKQFQNQKAAILEKGDKNRSFELAFLRNNLNQLPRFQYDLQQIQLPPNQIGFLISEFLWLPNANNSAAPIDPKLTFSASDTVSEPEKKAQLFKPVELTDEQNGSTILVSGNTAVINQRLKLNYPSDHQPERLPPEAVTALDYNYDFRNDLAFAGPGGFKLYKQQQDSTFTEVTNTLNLPASVLQSSYYGSWTRDLDLDGDLDLLLSATDGGASILRNNGDGTFDVRSHFDSSQNIRDFLWADFDQDGDSDAVILTAKGNVHYYQNERSGEFKQKISLPVKGKVYALDLGDINSDGTFEIVSWQAGQISSISYRDSTASWENESLIRFDKFSQRGSTPRLFIADLDNNAAPDVMISGQNFTRYWLSDENITLESKPHATPSHVYGLSDMNGDRRLDLVGLSGEQPSILINSGSKKYKARIIRPRASGLQGDRRINAFSIGGYIESRTGLQYTKKPIVKPWVHVGLGNYDEAEMMRIIWPNGSGQTEFAELGYDSKIINEQLLKGSCPWVLTYNGSQMEFVTDFLWRTSLGLRINAQGKSNVIHSVDWIKIEGDQLEPKKGMYDIRITADLWESHFFDYVSLMAVDHPTNTKVFVDERFKLPAPEQKLYPMKTVDPIEKVIDQDGEEVTQIVAEKDGKYVNSFELTSYQGLAREHYIEIQLGDKVPHKGKQKLIASGWIYPTDTSINFAISQGDQPALHGIRVEVPDGEGGWKVVKEDIGFPAGKNKTILVDLEGIFEPGTERRVRLYTNMEIYWDQIRVGTHNNNIKLKTQKLDATVAKLRYRGFSELVQKDRFSPTEPNYQQIAGTSPKWFDLEGFYTRFGDVRELTKKVDDRYVIMNAGDELVFKFPALDPPKEGWTRDFVLIGDGWVKDGDYNTVHSRTLLPLPYHGLKNYAKEPGLLQEDPVYQKHKKDWVEYHTRYITTENFHTVLSGIDP